MPFKAFRKAVGEFESLPCGTLQVLGKVKSWEISHVGRVEEIIVPGACCLQILCSCKCEWGAK